MHWSTLHHWSKFPTDLATLGGGGGGLIGKKTPENPLKLYFLLVGKHLNIENWRTTNPT